MINRDKRNDSVIGKGVEGEPFRSYSLSGNPITIKVAFSQKYCQENLGHPSRFLMRLQWGSGMNRHDVIRAAIAELEMLLPKETAHDGRTRKFSRGE
jgi:hypothetical protein